MSDKSSVLKKVKKIVSTEVGITGAELVSQCRKQEYVYARMIFTCICNKRFGITQKEIAEYLKLKQPMISLYLSNTVKDLQHNEKFRRKYNACYDRLNKLDEVQENLVTKNIILSK
ncbi:helix-turn-helix domain-containing protein [Chryseobacterium arthrosphaerae]|uniref:Helix-turn-helix domain-containing protein n=1 Tax=Chryseobacterium arthrosphaerae TaxID=651561 RepID=A0ABU7R316_9FLAO